MAPTHRGGALASVTDHYHRQLLSGDHLHHGLLAPFKGLTVYETIKTLDDKCAEIYRGMRSINLPT